MRRFPLASLTVPVVTLLLAAPAPERALAQDECVVVEDFAKAKVGQLPGDWKLRKDAGKGVYAVREDGGKRFLRAQAKGVDIQAAKQHEWNLDDYPVLAWRWRPVDFPKGADERESGRNDSALAVYMLVPYSKVRGPKAMKYVWSERVPAGTRLESNMGLTKVRVLRSGADKKGEWVEERVNVREDFMTGFGTKEVPKPVGIAVLTDSDETSSTATGDYADFRVCRK
ncbi:MAG: DUF3047 domain-containing protein [Candidatus Rokubacteria bacterium]|nr:DUF3047 domain-containing protein [Candidatus Rokubacteria bacterium]